MNTDEHIQLFVSVKKYLVPLWVEPANSVNIYRQKVCLQPLMDAFSLKSKLESTYRAQVITGRSRLVATVPTLFKLKII